MQNMDALHVNSFSSTNLSNNSQFVYDPLGRCVKITEIVSGSTTSTKQFLWRGSTRCEERDGSGSLSNGKQFLGSGQVNYASGTPTSYFYAMDHVGSIREMTDSSGIVGGTSHNYIQYGYDPYGQVSTLQSHGGVASDFQYAGYYHHNAGFGLDLDLTSTRAYNAALGRFISRDPIEEDGGINLYAYVDNMPSLATDPDGTLGTLVGGVNFTSANLSGGFQGTFLGGQLIENGKGSGWMGNPPSRRGPSSGCRKQSAPDIGIPSDIPTFILPRNSNDDLNECYVEKLLKMQRCRSRCVRRYLPGTLARKRCLARCKATYYKDIRDCEKKFGGGGDDD